MTNQMVAKIKSNLKIYKSDLKDKGVYWSIIHRLYKLPGMKPWLEPVVNMMKPSYVMLGKVKFFINKWDISVSQDLLQNKKWEEYTTKVLKDNIKVGNTVIDLGAHIGYFTLIAAQIVGPKGKVYAFEPDPFNFSLLKKNVEENGFTNIVLVQQAVSDKTGKIKLYISGENTADHRTFASRDGDRNSIPVNVTTLDNYFKNMKINFVKMDIQGSEVRALQGAKKLLKSNKKITILTEFWPYGLKQAKSSAAELFSMLTQKGFSIQTLINQNKKLIKLTASELLVKYPIEKDTGTNILCIKK